MRRLKIKILYLLLIVGFILIATACSNNEEVVESDTNNGSNAGGDKTVYIGLVNPPTNLNPINAQGNATEQMLTIMTDNLVGINSNMTFSQKLAKTIETTDNQTFTITLHENAKWSDGTPFTTKDVKFTMKMVTHPKVTTTFMFNYIEGLNDSGKLESGTEISGLEIVNDHTFNITTKYPIDMIFFKDDFASKIRFLPEHILKDAKPEELDKHDYMINPTVTLGAFTLEKYAKDQYLEFSINKDYYLGVPKVDKIYVKIMPASNIVAQLQTGELDMHMEGTALIPTEDHERISNLLNVNAEYSDISFPVHFIINNGNISDEKVRKALFYGINREMFVKQLLNGNGEIIHGVLPSAHPYYNKNIEPYPYDPEKAKQLFKEAGWNFDQVINFVVPVGNKTRERAAELAAENLNSIGLKVNIQKFDFPTTFKKLKEHEFDITVTSIPFRPDPSHVFNFFRKGFPNDFANYDGPELDKLIQSTVLEPDTEKRKAIFNEVQELFNNEAVVFPLYSEFQLHATSKAMKVGKSGYGMLDNIYQWEKE
ncbi:peptide/nickel transport system substrate-binding protein [Neobacillus niacini]|uniref:ABC transporter substrate-binding protein n=1 Tax=Neobacillus niacini TaxID=86668 RepID=UPI00285FD34D|nr:ABC transporter substrate-binding protein [Neobacillus niacini]MDR7079398.1 peptide/nickel transport system substrate-binding protein [Neobacillus niacini]